jgi:hypothetical protein
MNTTHDEKPRPRRQALAAVHLQNFQFLVALREALRADAAQASYEYGVDVATANVVRHASDEGLRALSYSVDRAVFTLRLRGTEIADLLRRPAVLRGLLVTVRESKAKRSARRRSAVPADPPNAKAER